MAARRHDFVVVDPSRPSSEKNKRAGVTPMHITNEVSRKHRGLRRAVAKQVRRYHDDLVSSLSIDNEKFVQQTFARARSRQERQRGGNGGNL
jgi:hypothetical protein